MRECLLSNTSQAGRKELTKMQIIKNEQMRAGRDPSQASLQGTSEPDRGSQDALVHMSGRRFESGVFGAMNLYPWLPCEPVGTYSEQCF